VRIGVHTGEIAMQGHEIRRMAVHVAARVMAAASPGEVLVTRTVRDLVVGSDIAFGEGRTLRLKGIPDAWDVAAAVSS
jgi:class 3 adenylate cyclase